MLVLALFHNQQVWKRTLTFTERGQRHFRFRLTSFQKSNSFRNQSLVHKALSKIDLLVDLECSCLYADGFRVGRDAFSLVDDHKIDSVPDQLDGQSQPGWTSTNDQDTCVNGRVHLLAPFTVKSRAWPFCASL